MIEKLKAYGIAALIAAVSILLLLLRHRSKKLEAAKYQLLQNKTEKEVRKTKEELEKITEKANQGLLGAKKRKIELENLVSKLEQEKKTYEEKYNQAVSILTIP